MIRSLDDTPPCHSAMSGRRHGMQTVADATSRCFACRRPCACSLTRFLQQVLMVSLPAMGMYLPGRERRFERIEFASRQYSEQPDCCKATRPLAWLFDLTSRWRGSWLSQCLISRPDARHHGNAPRHAPEMSSINNSAEQWIHKPGKGRRVLSAVFGDYCAIRRSVHCADAQCNCGLHS
jgi:hypothetical protein